jgi:predicted transcriptional regulator
MAQLALYLDDETMRGVDDAARHAGLSRSAWVREAIRRQFRNRLPEDFFDRLGAWQDARSVDEILGDIRTRERRDDRAPLE